MKQPIKYQYALDEENHIIDISMINKEHRIHSNYHCPSCGRELIAKLGEKKQKHFAHKFDTEGFPCNNETYLHQLAKIKIKEKFDKSESFFIKLREKVICSSVENCEFATNKHLCIKERDKLVNLKKYYNLCSIEKSIKDFRADLLLENTITGIKPILIEIFVTHPCTQDKINSKLPIIEIPIQSEEDIQIIENKTELCGQTYNFPIKNIYEPMEINYIIQKYVLFSSGKYSYISTHQISCKNIETPQFEHTLLDISVYDGKLEKTEFFYYAISLGYNLKNCSICQHYNFKGICKKSREINTPIQPNPSYAYFCNYYKTNELFHRIYKHATSKIRIKIIKNDTKSFNNIDFNFLYSQKIGNILNTCISQLEQCYYKKSLRLQVGSISHNLSCYYNSCERFKINKFAYGLKFYHSMQPKKTPLFLYCIKEGFFNIKKKSNTKNIYLKIEDEQSLKEFTSYTGITIYPCGQSIFHNIEERKHERPSKEQTNQKKEKEEPCCIKELPSKNTLYLEDLFKNESKTSLTNKNKEEVLDYIEKEFKARNIFIEKHQESPVSLRPLYNECKREDIKRGNISLKIFNTSNELTPIFIQPCLNNESPLKNIPTIVLRIDSQGMWKEWSHKNCLLIKEGKNGEFYNIINLNEIVPDETLNSF